MIKNTKTALNYSFLQHNVVKTGIFWRPEYQIIYREQREETRILNNWKRWLKIGACSSKKQSKVCTQLQKVGCVNVPCQVAWKIGSLRNNIESSHWVAFFRILKEYFHKYYNSTALSDYRWGGFQKSKKEFHRRRNRFKRELCPYKAQKLKKSTDIFSH